jgi:hypothetical protein
MRLKIFYWLCQKIFNIKVKENIKLPKLPILLRIIKMILFPLEAYIAKNQHFRYNSLTDTFTIFGMRYSGALFFNWSKYGLPVGTKFEIIGRENNILYLQKVEDKSE